ncbi:MAG: glycine cleavage system protein GcvH [Planctomycetota bacterium]
MHPEDRRYLESHEWAKLEGDLVVVGISDFAVTHLSDLVYVDLPPAGTRITKGERFGEIESVKAVSDLNAPVSGEVIEVHEELADNLNLLSENPYDEGWMIKIRPDDFSEYHSLLDAAAYQKVVESEQE